MFIGMTGRALGLACALVGVGHAVAEAKGARHQASRPAAERSRGTSLILARVWMDGRECPTGTARLRPLRGVQMDMSRFVEIGFVKSVDGKAGLQAFGQMLGQMVTLDLRSMWNDTFRDLKDRFMPIAPGSYVMTAINCTGNGNSWIGIDRANFFAAETGQAIPIKGANVIEVRPGEILDAGIVEIRSDEVGWFQKATGWVAAAPAPPDQQAKLREAFASVGPRLRFSTFRVGMQ
jgi:hypothetical protein